MVPPEFMAAILENKADDLPRLIAADWLDDHGESERAEFIRVQCRIAKSPTLRPDPQCQSPHDNRHIPCGDCWGISREQELLSNARGGQPCNWMKWSNLSSILYGMPYTYNGTEFRRGFVAGCECSWSDWLTHCDAILKATPLERVRLTTWPVSSVERVREMQVNIYSFAQQLSNPTSELERRWPGIEFELPRNEYRQYTATYRHTTIEDFREMLDRAESSVTIPPMPIQ